MLGHDTSAAAQDYPCKQGTDERVADTDPGGCQTIFPAELSGIADKDNGGKIRSAIGECSQPRTDRASTQDKAIDISGMASAIQTDTHQNGKVQNQDE